MMCVDVFTCLWMWLVPNKYPSIFKNMQVVSYITFL